MKVSVMNEIGNHFKPEFINRVDEAVVFHPLVAQQIEAIAGIQLQMLANRLADRDIELVVSPESLSLISEAGFDPVFGARPLKRAIQQTVENPLAQRILGGDFLPGDNIFVNVVDGEVAFSKN